MMVFLGAVAAAGSMFDKQRAILVNTDHIMVWWET
jgi:hypothetical protein